MNTPAAVAARYVAYRRKPPTATAPYNRAEPPPTTRLRPSPRTTPLASPSALADTQAHEPSTGSRCPARHFPVAESHTGEKPYGGPTRAADGNEPPDATVFSKGDARHVHARITRTD
ncbi:hypothetical protein GCM10027073_21430 [Streptomyces chlorus]